MKPIIMSTEDVRALLDGRKTMARQVMKPQPTYWNDGECVYNKDSIMGPELYNPIRVDKDGEQYPGKEVYGIYSDDGEYGCKAPCQPGDVLWVRETFARHNKGIAYKADQDQRKIKILKGFLEPPLHMPREAARLFLRVKDVRVERVQDITAEDALKEGCTGIPCDQCAGGYFRGCTDCMNSGWQEPPQLEFSQRWDARNAKRGYGWDTNPWVWVIEFERIAMPQRWPEVEE